MHEESAMPRSLLVFFSEIKCYVFTFFFYISLHIGFAPPSQPRLGRIRRIRLVPNERDVISMEIWFRHYHHPLYISSLELSTPYRPKANTPTILSSFIGLVDFSLHNFCSKD